MSDNNARLNRCKKLLAEPVKVDRSKAVPRCRKCLYYRPDFRFRSCLFADCPYGKNTRSVFRRKPLRIDKIIGKKTGGLDA